MIRVKCHIEKSSKLGSSILVSTSILFWIVVSSCNPFSKSLNNLLTINIDSIYTKETVRYSELFSNFEIIPLETRQDNLFGASGARLKIANNHIYLLDSRKNKALDIYTIRGDFVRRIQCIGRGPGEYITPADFDVDPITGNVFIFDSGGKKVLMYSSETGDHLESFKIPDPKFFTSFLRSGDNFFYFTGWGKEDDPESAMLYVANGIGETLDKCLYFSEEDIVSSGDVILTNTYGNFFKSQDGIKVFWRWSNTVYNYEYNHCTPFLRFEGKIKKITDSTLGTTRNSGIQSYSDNQTMAMIKHDEFYALFYILNENRIICAKSYLDDMTNLKQVNFHSIWGDYVLALHNPALIRHFDRLYTSDQTKSQKMDVLLLEALISGDIKIDTETRTDLIEKIKGNIERGGGTSNPILIMYKLK